MPTPTIISVNSPVLARYKLVIDAVTPAGHGAMTTEEMLERRAAIDAAYIQSGLSREQVSLIGLVLAEQGGSFIAPTVNSLCVVAVRDKPVLARILAVRTGERYELAMPEAGEPLGLFAAAEVLGVAARDIGPDKSTSKEEQARTVALGSIRAYLKGPGTIAIIESGQGIHVNLTYGAGNETMLMTGKYGGLYCGETLAELIEPEKFLLHEYNPPTSGAAIDYVHYHLKRLVVNMENKSASESLDTSGCLWGSECRIRTGYCSGCCS